MAELTNRDEQEAMFARRIARLNARQKRELQGLLGQPPDIANVPRDFWERVESEMKEELLGVLILLFVASAEQHGLSADAAQIPARVFAETKAADTARSFTQTTQQKLASQTLKWRQRLERGEKIAQRGVGIDLNGIFNPRRAEQVATTTTTSTTVAGGEEGVAATVGRTNQDTWFTRSDGRVCPICEPLHRAKRSEWSDPFPQGPPAHPNCRCWIHYANEKRGAAAIA